jgi:hypothetical protein
VLYRLSFYHAGDYAKVSAVVVLNFYVDAGAFANGQVAFVLVGVHCESAILFHVGVIAIIAQIV